MGLTDNITLPAPLGDAITSVPTKVVDSTGKVVTQNVPTTFNEKTADYFSIFGPLLTPFTDLSTVKFADLPKIPVGTPLSVSALSPPLGTNLPTSAAVVPFKAPATVKWHVSTLEFGDSNAAPTIPATLTDLLPASSTETTSGTYQVVNGDLMSDTLSILPWPSPKTAADTNKRVPTQLRAFVLRAELSIWIPGFARTSFIHPTGLVGVVNSWSSVFGSEDLSIPSTGAPADDKLSAFSSLFELAVDTLAPELGKATSILINPVDKTSAIPGAVSQIVETTPSLNVQAAIDVGAYLSGIASNAGAPPSVNTAVVNVGKVLSSIFALPIAVDINGVTRSRTIIPAVPQALPSVKSLPGSSLIGGSLPVGSLNTLIKTDISAAAFAFKATTDTKPSADPLVLKAAGPALNGFRITPLPRLVSMASTASPKIEIVVTLPTSLAIPGRALPLDVSISLPPIYLPLPTIRVPSLAVFLRPYINDFPNASPDALALLDPYTSKAYQGVGTMAILKAFSETLSVPADVFTAQLFDAYKVPVPPVIGNITSLLYGAKKIIGYLATAIVQDLYVPTTQVGDASIRFNLAEIRQTSPQSKKELWYSTTPAPTGGTLSLNDSNVSTILWLGMPDLLDAANGYRLRLTLTGEGASPLITRHFGSLWFPQPKTNIPYILAVADTEPVAAGVGWAAPIPSSSDPKYVEDGPEGPPLQIQAKNKPYWNDQPKYAEWIRGTVRPPR